MAAICVFCSASGRIDHRHVLLAEAVGAELAHRGHSLVWGGGRVSCMGAVARAARAGGARTVGVIPAALKTREHLDTEADQLVVTADMRSRKAEMDARADAFLALPGGLGTLEELLEIWVARSLGMHAKPVVALDPDGVFARLREQVDELMAAGFLHGRAADALAWASSVPQAFDLLATPVAATEPTAAEVLEAEP